MTAHANLFHSGIVVDDLEAAKDVLGAELGVRWTPVIDNVRPIIIEGRTVDLRFRVVYSIDGPHRYELVEAIPDTLWQGVPGQPARLHHVGYWSDDIQADGAALEQAGAPTVAVIATADGEAPVFRYHRSRLGFYIELVSSSVRAGMEQVWSE